VPLEVAYDGTGSTDPDAGDTLTYAWDLDGDGAFDDSTAASPQRTYSTAGTFQVRLRVRDSGGLESTSDPIVVDAGNSPPTPVIDPPSATSAAWAVGDTITFSGSATDPESGPVPASQLSWQVDLHHCGSTDPASCHVHPLQTFAGVTSGAFPAPDHEYPSWIVLTLTATDGSGGVGTATQRLDPKTVGLTLSTEPDGGSVSLGPNAHTAPHTASVIAGSRNTIGTPSPQLFGTTTSYVFDSWSDGGGRSHEIVAPLSGSASYTATFTPDTTPPTTCPAGEFTAEYFDNQTLEGTPVLTRCETAIDNDWDNAAPAPGVPADGFSVRWTGAPTFTAGEWRFTTRSDDGIRLSVDGASVIDNWTDHGPTTDTATRTLTAGAHEVVVEYYEKNGGALASAAFTPVATGPGDCPAGQLRAEYFVNRDLAGTPALTRCETAIDNDWGTGSPAPGIPPNDFSVRWSGTRSFAGGEWTFTTHSDDGVRLEVDGTLVIDNWTDHGPTTDTATRSLTAGDHEVVVEYYEKGGGAVARASWAPTGG
jgi:PKD repeat protein